MYDGADFDLAGFSVGAMERGGMLPNGVAEGDILIGMPSSGVHSNGFSLVRRVVEASGADYQAAAPFDLKQTLGEALLRPTRITARAGTIRSTSSRSSRWAATAI